MTVTPSSPPWNCLAVGLFQFTECPGLFTARRSAFERLVDPSHTRLSTPRLAPLQLRSPLTGCQQTGELQCCRGAHAHPKDLTGGPAVPADCPLSPLAFPQSQGGRETPLPTSAFVHVTTFCKDENRSGMCTA